MSKLTGPHHRTVKRGLKMAKPKCHKCEEKCGKGKANPEIVEKLDRAYKDFLKTDSKSLLKKHLTPDVFDRLRRRKTALGSTLLDCVRSGLENPDSAVGLYAADPDCYALFADVFDPVIRDYHAGAGAAAHPPPDWGGAAQGLLGNLDPEGAHVVSTRVRCCRNLRGYAFHPRLQEAQYEEIEAKVAGALRELRGPLRGAYRPLASMDEETRRRLVDEHLLFKEGDRFLRAADACRFWPAGRGIFLNDARTFLAWVNEEDHARLISLQPGGHLGEVYQRLVEGVGELEKRLAFMRDARLGYLTFCPTNLGTTIRASVHVRVPRLAEDEEKLNELAERYHLQVRGTSGEHSAAEGGVYDISNKRRLGLTEYQVVKEMFDGVAEILKREKSGGY